MKTVEDSLNHYRNELNLAAHSFYAWKSFNNIVSKNNENLKAINENALSWNLISHSLQCTFFISLGRLFDKDSKTFSIYHFLNYCGENIQEFSKINLRKRKTGEGPKPVWLDEYMATAYEPVPSDFRELKKETKKWGKIFSEIYQPIRHKVFAHKEIDKIGKSEQLFSGTNIGQIQEMLLFLYAIECFITQLFHNGRKCQLNEFTHDIELRASKDLESLIESIKKGALA